MMGSYGKPNSEKEDISEFAPVNVAQFRTIVNDLAKLYEIKNSDYGSSIEEGIHDIGYIYSVCQLYNKYKRFKNLISKDDFEGRVGESLVDTLLDMAVYAIETARVMQNDLKSKNEGVSNEF